MMFRHRYDGDGLPGGTRWDRRFRRRHRPRSSRAGARISGSRFPRWRSDSWLSPLPFNTSIAYLLVLIASTSKNGMLVSMKLSEKYAVPSELALLYDFVNTLDQRR